MIEPISASAVNAARQSSTAVRSHRARTAVVRTGMMRQRRFCRRSCIADWRSVFSDPGAYFSGGVNSRRA
jgi:hypothetical protein